MNNGTISAGPVKDSSVVFHTSQSVELRGVILKMTRLAVVFELYNPAAVLRLSEVLKEFKIVVAGRALYSGQAVLRNHISTTAAVIVCEATLDEAMWVDFDFAETGRRPGGWGEEYRAFINEWQKLYIVRPEFKLILADMQTYFSDLRLWLDHLEIGLRTARGADAAALELEAAREVGESTNPTITTLFEKFEQAAEGLGEESQPSHQLFARRQLHPLLLGSPFLHRCYTKPLGFAGDYEMVNMMLRNPCEGASLFAKVVNVWFLAQPPAEAHRNRIGHLTQQLLNAALRGMREKRTARAISVGCGPAQEVQRFIAGHDVGGALEMTMLDFNEETLAYTRGVMDNLKRRHGRAVNLEYIKKSVAQLIKESGKAAGTSAFAGKFDFVYCAGLFDYLPGQVCQRLMDLMHDWVAPGGMLLATNVASCNPRRLTMDHVMAWHLIYRTGAELAALKPLAAAPEDCRTFADGTGVNIFLEVAKHSRG